MSARTHPTRTRRAGAAGLVLLAVLAAGCTDDDRGGAGGAGGAGADPAAAAAERARAYMQAAVADDWKTACDLMAAPRRAACRGRHPVPESPEPAGPTLGPVLLDRPPTRVPATAAHPAGWAVIVSHTVTWPGEETRTTRTALRMTDEGGKWWVEQRSDVSDAELTRAADPAAAALSREVRG
ncbi:hypothetical protein [Streptomyces sp. NPDC089919]|uniref:hypothetical protein n=1 Tax=Streptomyces sp. NPDC089919 TaxID=3155188 RepID=UPI003427EC14